LSLTFQRKHTFYFITHSRNTFYKLRISKTGITGA